MKNFKIVFVMAIMCLLTSSVKAQSISDILKGVVGSVVGDKATTETSIKGTWKYSGPACEFESSSVLAQAGGSAVATKWRIRWLRYSRRWVSTASYTHSTAMATTHRR